MESVASRIFIPHGKSIKYKRASRETCAYAFIKQAHEPQTQPVLTFTRGIRIGEINQPMRGLGKMMSKTEVLVQRIREMIDSDGYEHSDRLPPERVMCTTLGVTRNQLRQALSELVAQGLIWRHVGRGTFVGARPVLNLDDITYLRDQVKPEHVVSVRFAIEPELARLAAIYAHKADHDLIQLCADRCRNAPDWRGYEAWDNKLHHAIARATQNKLYLYYFETLNEVRRSVVWGQPRKNLRPAENYSSFLEHDVIVQAVLSQQGDLAAQAMLEHLRSVYGRILPSMGLAIPKEFA